jgi:hypothetical protein
LKKIIYILLVLNQYFAFSQQTNKKQFFIKRSVLTSVGSSTAFTTNQKYSIQQSIGQSSIIGQKTVNSIIVQQGFLTNNIYFKVDNSKINSFNETLDFVISPNPFIDYIKISFAKKTTNDVYIKIYDINGKIFNSLEYQPTTEIVIPMKRFSIGTYLIQIKSGRNTSTKKILKIE